MSAAQKDGLYKQCACGEARWHKCPDSWHYTERNLDAARLVGRARDRFYMSIDRWVKITRGKAEHVTTRTDAEEIAREIHAAIVAGTFDGIKAGTLTATGEQKTPAPEASVKAATVAVALEAFITAEIDGHPTKKPNSKTNDRAIVRRLIACRPAGAAALAGRSVATLTLADYVAFRVWLPIALGTKILAASTWGKYRTVIGQLSRWLKANQYHAADPIAEAPLDQRKKLKRSKAAQRRRRVSPEEERKLLAAAAKVRRMVDGARLYELIIAALETGLRVGELLALQWRDVDLVNRTLFVRAAEEELHAAKIGANEGRTIGLTARLIAEVFAPAKLVDPAGAPWPRGAYVFGNLVGERIGSIDKAWNTCVLIAFGHTPAWTDTGALTPDCLRWLAQIDLHFHDLRHEAGCRLLELNVPGAGLEAIQGFYGHASLEQTATYLHATGAATVNLARVLDNARVQAKTQAKGTADEPETGRGGGILAVFPDRHPRLVKGRRRSTTGKTKRTK